MEGAKKRCHYSVSGSTSWELVCVGRSFIVSEMVLTVYDFLACLLANFDINNKHIDADASNGEHLIFQFHGLLANGSNTRKTNFYVSTLFLFRSSCSAFHYESVPSA